MRLGDLFLRFGERQTCAVNPRHSIHLFEEQMGLRYVKVPDYELQGTALVFIHAHSFCNGISDECLVTMEKRSCSSSPRAPAGDLTAGERLYPRRMHELALLQYFAVGIHDARLLNSDLTFREEPEEITHSVDGVESKHSEQMAVLGTDSNLIDGQAHRRRIVLNTYLGSVWNRDSGVHIRT
jgi:hypothetical protein